MNKQEGRITYYIDNILDGIVSIYIAGVLGVLPLYFKDGYKTIASDKCVLYIDTSLIFILIILLFLFLKKIIRFFQKRKDHTDTRKKPEKKKMSYLDMAVAVYGIGVFFSYLFSNYRMEAFLGTDGWYMGAVTQLIFVSVYFFVSRLWKGHKFDLYIALCISFVVYLLGFLNRFGFYPIDMGEPNPAFISTVGNINWFCGYMIITLFFAVGILWQSHRLANHKTLLQWMLRVYAFLGFATLAVQGSDTAMISLMAVFLTLFFLSPEDLDVMKGFASVFTVFSIACFAIFILRKTEILNMQQSEHYRSAEVLTESIFPVVFVIISVVLLSVLRKVKDVDKYKIVMMKLSKILLFALFAVIVLLVLFIIANTLCDGRIVDEGWLIFSDDWGSHRGADWKIGLLCFSGQNILHKLFGVGPDCMSAYIYSGANEEVLNKAIETFDGGRLTNAHNEFITMVVNQGVLGLISYAAIFVISIRKFLTNNLDKMIVAACGLCMVAYISNAMFSFQHVMNAPFIFIVLGIGENFCRKENRLN